MKTVGLLSLFLVLAFLTHAQDVVWKKEVSRVIDVRNEKTRDGEVARAIFRVLKKGGQLMVYDPVSRDFSQMMSKWSLEEIIMPQVDEQTVVDPVTGKEVHVKTIRNIDRDKLYKYRILEEWTFMPATGKITIQEKYIAPLEDIIADDGIYRGTRALFWLNYTDVMRVLGKEDNKQLLAIVEKALWRSYFEKSKKGSTGKKWQAMAMSEIKMSSVEDTNTYFLREEHADTPLSAMLWSEMKKGTITPWAVPYSKPFPINDLDSMATKVDTQVIIDPVTGNEVIKVTQGNMLRSMKQYNVLQDWKFDPLKGIAQINITGVAIDMSHHTMYDNRLGNTFSIRYSDALPVINRWDAYHYKNTFAMYVWEGFFFGDKKPVLQ